MISVKCDALRNIVPLYNLKNVKITHGVLLLLVKLQVELCNFTKSNTSPWVFFTFLKMYKLYQNEERITYNNLFRLQKLFT